MITTSTQKAADYYQESTTWI